MIEEIYIRKMKKKNLKKKKRADFLIKINRIHNEKNEIRECRQTLTKCRTTFVPGFKCAWKIMTLNHGM